MYAMCGVCVTVSLSMGPRASAGACLHRKLKLNWACIIPVTPPQETKAQFAMPDASVVAAGAGARRDMQGQRARGVLTHMRRVAPTQMVNTSVTSHRTCCPRLPVFLATASVRKVWPSHPYEQQDHDDHARRHALRILSPSMCAELKTGEGSYTVLTHRPAHRNSESMYVCRR